MRSVSKAICPSVEPVLVSLPANSLKIFVFFSFNTGILIFFGKASCFIIRLFGGKGKGMNPNDKDFKDFNISRFQDFLSSFQLRKSCVFEGSNPEILRS